MYNRIYLGGTFDCLHRGHLNLFRQARKTAHEVVVALNTDDFAARYKRRPIMPLADRCAVLEACRLVDFVQVNICDEDSKPSIIASGADCIGHGDDWTGLPLMHQMGLTQEWLDAHKLVMVTIPYTTDISTTEIIKRMKQED